MAAVVETVVGGIVEVVLEVVEGTVVVDVVVGAKVYHQDGVVAWVAH